MPPLERNPDLTRKTLLEAAFQEIYRCGYQAASLEQILTRAGVTKGALYHHFRNKRALGYAVVDELIRGHILANWVRPIEQAEDPIDGLLAVLLRKECFPHYDQRLGCPLNNLAQEMSPLDEGFRKRLQGLYREWRNGIAKALRRGQARGQVRADLDPFEAADFLTAALEGSISLAKSAQSRSPLDHCRAGLARYLESLRVTEAGAAESVDRGRHRQRTMRDQASGR
ncbi:MAG TPA: TetR family transcriptional regulator C-terminal domain-containing protein [Terriglobales bacterium]|nr:TetR family transcriptional regulator C-terminal domain-containing protein [Terriglobales bacterium]